MNTIAWKTIKATLAGKRVAAARPPTNAFWTDFGARARLTRQAEPTSAVLSMTQFRARLIPVTAALAACLIALLFVPLRHVAAEDNQIISLEVLAPYSAVIIMNDQQKAGTLLLVTDLADAEKQGG